MPGTRALEGLRVVEAGGMVAAAYAAKLMADLGAEVIKVESPDGDPSRRQGPYPPGMEGDLEASGLFLYLNTNKKAVALDLEQGSDRATLQALLADADVFIHNLPVRQARRLGLDYASVAPGLPGLVYTWVTPFGLTGPRAEWEADNVTVVSAGGWASITPGKSPHEDLPPLLAFGRQGDFQAANTAAVATMGALFAKRRTGRGQLVEVSAQEVIAAALELAYVTYSYTGLVASRLGSRSLGPTEAMECRDGLIFVMTVDPHQWDAFVHLMGDPEWSKWEIFEDRFKRGENRDVLRTLIQEWMAQYTVQEVFDMAGEARLPFAPVSQIGDLLDSPHLKARGFFAEVRHPKAGSVSMPGAPYIMPATPWEIRSPAPLLGQHNDEILARYRPGVRA